MSVGGANENLVLSIALVCLETERRWRISVNFLKLVRDILDLAECVEARPADPEHVVCKAEEFIEFVRVIFTLSDEDVF